MAMPLGVFPMFVAGETASPAKCSSSSLRLLTSVSFQANLRTTFVTYATLSNPATEPKKRVTGFTKIYRVSPELNDFLGGVPEVSRSVALKKIWAYITEKELQEPTNRKIIVCDEKLKTIFGGKDRVEFVQVSGLISPHFLKLSRGEHASFVVVHLNQSTFYRYLYLTSQKNLYSCFQVFCDRDMMLKVPDHQVAGHEAGVGKLGPLIDDSGRFYKPLQSDKRGSEEVAFYESFTSNTEIPEHIRRFFPIFYGTKVMKASTGSEHPHIVLQDIASSHVKPSVMDIKIGARTWAPEASEAYVAKCLRKDRESTSVSVGFRISGLRVYISDELGFYKPDRDSIRKASPDDVKLILRKFISSNSSSEMETDPDCSLASVYGGPNGILAQLLELKAWFEDQTIYHFYACSILFMYEKGLALKGSNAEVKLIDFAHVAEGRGVIDHNFLGGLCSLIRFISDILKETTELTVENGHV